MAACTEQHRQWIVTVERRHDNDTDTGVDQVRILVCPPIEEHIDRADARPDRTFDGLRNGFTPDTHERVDQQLGVGHDSWRTGGPERRGAGMRV